MPHDESPGRRRASRTPTSGGTTISDDGPSGHRARRRAAGAGRRRRVTGQWAQHRAGRRRRRPGRQLHHVDGHARGRRHTNERFGGPVAGYAPAALASWIRKTGGVPAPSGKGPTGQHLFLEHDRPEIAAAARWYLEPVDYLTMRFTGVAAASHASMTAALAHRQPAPRPDGVRRRARRRGRRRRGRSCRRSSPRLGGRHACATTSPTSSGSPPACRW